MSNEDDWLDFEPSAYAPAMVPDLAGYRAFKNNSEKVLADGFLIGDFVPEAWADAIRVCLPALAGDSLASAFEGLPGTPLRKAPDQGDVTDDSFHAISAALAALDGDFSGRGHAESLMRVMSQVDDRIFSDDTFAWHAAGGPRSPHSLSATAVLRGLVVARCLHNFHEYDQAGDLACESLSWLYDDDTHSFVRAAIEARSLLLSGSSISYVCARIKKRHFIDLVAAGERFCGTKETPTPHVEEAGALGIWLGLTNRLKPRSAAMNAIAAGGDTDTVASIACLLTTAHHEDRTRIAPVYVQQILIAVARRTLRYTSWVAESESKH